jgi:hypothetical protein
MESGQKIAKEGIKKNKLTLAEYLGLFIGLIGI